MLIETASTLGPATVVEASEAGLVVQRDGETIRATPALGYAYAAAPGDVVLVIGQGDDHYVIGVLRGRGRMTFVAAGDLELSAPYGRVRLTAGEAVEAEAPVVTLQAGKLQLLARFVAERFESAYRWVTELFQIQTGRMRTVAESTVYVKGERIIEQAVKDVKIDGTTIRLG